LGEGLRITFLKEIFYPNSLGFFYATLTQFLGFRPCYDEGKVMALAAYGKPILRQDLRLIEQ
jgi:carbamoyltransferase